MSSVNVPLYSPAAAIELTWWKWPAWIASASWTACRVPSTLAVRWLAASAVRS